MSTFALALVLLSAVLHASWNFLAKRSQGGVAFVWLAACLGTLIYLPLGLVVWWRLPEPLGWREFGVMGGSAAIHTVYFVLLQQGYRVGDLSVVYPLARGTGPFLSTVAAVLLLGEQPTALALAGALLVAVGVFLFTGGQGSGNGGARWAVMYGLLTGLVIAGYTLWDKVAVSTVQLHPVLLDFGANMGRTLFLLPWAWQQREQVAWEWQNHRLEAVGVAVLSSMAYLLVLSVLVFTPVSYVAPTREMSILVGTLLGARFLQEGHTQRRLLAAGTMVVGVMALALG